MRQLTNLDAQFLSVETAQAPTHIQCLAIYDPSDAPDGIMTIDRLTQAVSDRLHLLPAFRLRLVQVPLSLDLPYWTEDPDFDLDFHIRESAVPSPGTDRQLADLVARIMTRPLDRSRPLWELYLIQGLEGGRVGLLTKIHHALVDGVSGRELLSVLLDQHPNGIEISPAPPRSQEPRLPSELEMFWRGVSGLPRQPLLALRSASTLPTLLQQAGLGELPVVSTAIAVLDRLRRLGRKTTVVLETTDARVPRTVLNGATSAHRCVAFGSVELDQIKEIKREANVTVNDVVVAACAGAVRRWLDERGELPDAPLVAAIPVSVRTGQGDGELGNRISMMVVPIPTDEPDALERLHRTHEILRSAKERHEAVPANLLTDAANFIPPAVQALAARRTLQLMTRIRPPVNLVISNIPGPRDPLYCIGARMEANYPVSNLIEGVGLNITVASYGNHVDIGVVSDRERMDDPWELLDAMHTELETLSLSGSIQ